jgi:hypothetical protein
MYRPPEPLCRLREAATALAASVGRQCVTTAFYLHLKQCDKTCETMKIENKFNFNNLKVAPGTNQGKYYGSETPSA